MSYPPGHNLHSVIPPDATPITTLGVGIEPPSLGFSTLNGGAAAQGSSATYSDLYAFLWYQPSRGFVGFDTRPGLGAKINRHMHTLGNIDERRILANRGNVGIWPNSNLYPDLGLYPEVET